MSHASPSSHLLLRTLRGEVVERPPVWAMRQAGRWDPEFRRLRSGLSFFEFSENVELAARASLLPRRFGVDAIILFYDITTLAVAMGIAFELKPKEGPVPIQPVRRAEDVSRLLSEPAEERFGHILELLRLVRRELAGALPVLVFAGAPFTLASYCISTGKDLEATRRFAQEQPVVWEELLERITQATVVFLRSLAGHGADAYQLFDSWAGGLALSEYAGWAQRRHQAIFDQVQKIPSILFVKECPYLEHMAASGARAVSLGTTHDLAAARDRFPGLVFQGNVDHQLLKTGTPEEVAAATRRCLEAGKGRRHIVNLSHGVDPATPVDNFVAFIEAVAAS
jgi:uroporphyrinogen decarboxylase